MKKGFPGDFTRAWAGISSLELSLSATWTGASARHYSLDQVIDWMCRMPARLAGLDRKGAIEPGYDADLCWHVADNRTPDATRLTRAVSHGERRSRR
jgi:allantoinase